MSNAPPEWWTTDEWETPMVFFNKINTSHGPFDLDPCARPETAKAPNYFTKADDGLSKEWRGRVWCNPPYSNPRPWIEKALRSFPNIARAVFLLPNSTDTTWFHELVKPNAEIIFLRGRIRFIGWMGTPISGPKGGNIIATFSLLSIREQEQRELMEK